MGWGDMTAATIRTTQRAFSGGLVSYEPKGGAPYEVTFVPYRDSHLAVELQTGLAINSTDPEVSFQLTDLTRFPIRGDHVVRNGVRYEIVDPQKDGEGAVKCKLKRAA